MILCSLWTTQFHVSYPTDHASSPCLPLFSLTTSIKKKQQEQVTKKFSKWKQAHVGMEPSKTSQTRWERHYNTFTPSLHLVPFFQLCTTKNSLHTLNEHDTEHYSLHSLPHKRQSIPDSATFSSNKISQHNLKLPTYHADPALLTVSAYKADYTCHAQQQLHWLWSILYSNQVFY